MSTDVRESRVAKRAKIDALREKFEQAEHVVFTDYRGVTVSEITALRSKLYEKDTRYHVVKNNLCKILLQELSIEGFDEQLSGPTAIAFLPKDPSDGIKEIVSFAKDAPVEVKGGYIDGEKLEADEVVRISALPSRDILIAQLMNGVQGNTIKLVSVLQAVPRSLVYALKAIQEQKG